jgi:uracil-DNA glycosylase
MTKKPPPPSAAPFVPSSSSLQTLADAADDCRGCDLYRDATQAVFGEGKKGARVLFVGEQPGDKEDVVGRPFVGPAGRLLDKALLAAGIDRAQVYVTNAVKHFKFTTKGKKRLHEKPSAAEVKACRPWLDKEIEIVKPKVIVCLGATAAQAIFGSGFKVTQHRGEVFRALPIAPAVVATVHPSSILRMRTDDERHEAERLLIEDLKKVAAALDD